MNMTVNRAGHFGLLALFAAFVAWFTANAWQANATVVNLILILPMAALSLAIIGGIAVHLVRDASLDAHHATEKENRTLRQRYGVPIACLLFTLYVLSLETIGFDIAGIVFCAAVMVLMGQRNWLIIVAYSLLMGIGPVWLLEHPMGIPVETVIIE